MTLRHRLLLVYLIVVLLSAATFSVAFYEFNQMQRVYGALRNWQDVVLVAQKLKAAFPPSSDGGVEENAFTQLLAKQRINLAGAREFVDVSWIQDRYREDVSVAYGKWSTLPPEARQPVAEKITANLASLATILESDLDTFKLEAEKLELSKWLLLAGVLGLMVLQVMMAGWLLRRWLLWPMERLNRQVQALAKDLPPPEPLLSSPLEMARLAGALDQARQSLHVYRQQLIDNERLTTIGQFAAQLAHNLRNPLASIRAAAQVTARHERGNGYVGERMDEVIACVDRLNHWIAGLMEVARRDPTPTRGGDVVPLLHRVREAVGSDLAIKELTLTVEVPAGGLVCAHDPATLEQALIAMVVNAIEASPLGRAIVLRAELVEGNVECGVQNANCPVASGTVCRISVNDEGPGLPSDDPERIFEFSYSTKQKGMGLGLALTRLALERQGGEAHARNRTTGGAMVYVDLPVGEGEGGAETKGAELGIEH